MVRFLITLIICIAANPILVLGQESTNVEKTSAPSPSRSNFLHGKHSIAVSIGLLVQVKAKNDASVNGTTSDTRVDGAVGTLTYTHWFQRDWAINISLGVLGAEANSSVSGSEVFSETGSVIPILFGVRYQPSRLALSPTIRPYVSGAAGPYVGFATKSRAGLVTTNETISEATLGMHVLAGMDWFFSRFSVGVNAGYHFVTDFEQRIGSQKNYSGPEFSLAVGILLGRGASK